MDSKIKFPDIDSAIFYFNKAISNLESAKEGSDSLDAASALDCVIKDAMRKYAAEAVKLNACHDPIESNKTPFNLKAAMRGQSIVTRDGRPAKFVAYETGSEFYPVVSLIDGEIQTQTEQGLFSNDGSECEDDLFMAANEKTIWLNVYFDDGGNCATPFVYQSGHDAEKSSDANWPGEKYIAVPVKLK